MKSALTTSLVIALAGCQAQEKAEPAASARPSAAPAESGSKTMTEKVKEAAEKVVEDEPAANKFCKGSDGTLQDCAIACKTSKADDVCKLYADKTTALCDKIGKAKCQEICDADKNDHACAKAKTMK
jgi:hypothetical protein